MSAEQKSTCPEESVAFLCDVTKITESTDVELDSSNPYKNIKISIMLKKKVADSDSEEDKSESVNSEDVITFRVYRNKKIQISKPLILLRITLFLWFGAAAIPMPFLSIFMKQKGLTLVQFSSAFSVTYLFQLITSSISGIIADKIGNAKPLLMFHMLATVAVTVCMLLSPNVDRKHCDHFKVDDFVCFEIYDVTTLNLTHCNLTFSTNDVEFDFKSYKSLQDVSNSSRSKLLSDNNEKTFNSQMCVINALCKGLKENNCTSLCRKFENECLSSDKKLVIIYLILILSLVTFWTNVFRFLDVAVMFMIEKHNSNFGFERLFAIAGQFTVAILIAFVMNASTLKETEQNYDVVYWIFACLMLLAFTAVYNVKVPIKAPGKGLTKKALKLIKNVDVLSFFIITFVLGNGFGSSYFHFLFLEKLNAPRILFGLHRAFTAVYGIPILLTSKWWLKKFGTTNIFVLSLLFYTISRTSYSFLYNPWWSLAIQSTSVFTFHLLWVSVVVHSHKIAPEGMVSTIIAFLGAIHFGLGRSTGVMGFGFLTNAFGQRTAYRLLAAMCLITAVLYSIFLYWRHSSSTKKSIKNATEVIEEHLNNDAALK